MNRDNLHITANTHSHVRQSRDRILPHRRTPVESTLAQKPNAIIGHLVEEGVDDVAQRVHDSSADLPLTVLDVFLKKGENRR